jgi:glycogen(starch) synthase
MNSVLVMDQWAGQDVAPGTNKNWLYGGLAQRFRLQLINADAGWPAKRESWRCLLSAAFLSPFSVKKQYHRRMEWAAKRPAAFRARTHRFQQALRRLGENFDAVLQVGCLFGPVSLNGAMLASYHDQTMAMVERDWREWLPPDFLNFREEWMELEKASLGSRHLILTYSNCTKDSMINDYGIPENRVSVAPTACKIAYPKPNEVLGPRKESLLFASTDFYRKGGDLVFEAFEFMRRKKPSLELILVGGPSPLPLPEGAKHLGLVSQDQMRKLYLECSLIVHPARHDAFPNVLKEALACGLPAICSDSAGIPEIIKHGSSGVVLVKPDGKQLAEVGLKLLESPSRLTAMREACLAERDRFKPETCVKRIAQAMEKSWQGNFAGGAA